MDEADKTDARCSGKLIRKLAEGDTAALTGLFELYKTDVYRLALLILRDTQLAQDVTQEVFIHVNQYASQMRGGEVKAWVMAITRNTSYNALKKRGHEVAEEEDFFASIPGEKEESLEFYDMIAPLEELDREIITLYIVNGLKHKEIASIVHLKESAVRKRYVRALKKLKDTMTTAEERSGLHEKVFGNC